MSTAASAVRPLLFMLSGLLIWAAHFTLIYSFTALACARRFADVAVFGVGVVPLVVGIATLLAMVALVAILQRAVHRPSAADGEARANSSFVHYVAAAATVLALVGVLWEMVPILLIPACS